MAAARFQSTLRGRSTLVAITSFDSNEASLARRGASLCQEPVLRLPLPFNDADEVSCRAGAIKCSRCRASFAPIRTAFAERNLVPPLDRLLAGPLSETKNQRNSRLRRQGGKQ